MSSEVVTMHDMFSQINEAAGLSRKFFVLNENLSHAGVKILALVSKITGKEPLLSEFNIYMLNRNNEFDCSKAQKDLGFHCRPFSESIRDTVIWLQKEGFLDAHSAFPPKHGEKTFPGEKDVSGSYGVA